MHDVGGMQLQAVLNLQTDKKMYMNSELRIKTVLAISLDKINCAAWQCLSEHCLAVSQ